MLLLTTLVLPIANLEQSEALLLRNLRDLGGVGVGFIYHLANVSECHLLFAIARLLVAQNQGVLVLLRLKQ